MVREYVTLFGDAPRKLLIRVRANCAGSDMLNSLFADRRNEAESDNQ